MSVAQKKDVFDKTQILKKLKIYQDEHQRLTVLFNITRNISTELKLDNLLLIIMDEVRKALRADRCTVFILDREKNELRCGCGQRRRCRQESPTRGCRLAGT